MSKAMSYVVVGVVAFLVGGLSFQLIGRTSEGNAKSKFVDGQANGGEATAVAPRAFMIEGMSCQGCADSITSALMQIPGVQSANVSLVDKRAVVLAKESEVSTERILAAVVAVGYKGQLASAARSTPTMTASAEDARRSHGPAPYPAEMNKKFADPKADIEQFVKRFENEARDVYVKRQDITRAVGLRLGDAVADIGAGTGLFTLLFADRVRPKGTIYAVDIGPAFLKYIAEQATKHGHEGVITTVLNTQDSAMLPSDAIDVTFICDTYHHFDHPERMLASIHRALRPGGRLVIIDFDLRKDSSDFVKQRARAPKEVYYREITAAGFEQINTKNAPTIKDNFYVEFRRVEHKSQVQPAATTDRAGPSR
jgi:ubiquinone/menaquinone biosynthesis C-methylase UbiE/copper chaperone CopZ